MKQFICIILLIITSFYVDAQAITYAEKLGWKKSDKVVILHVDDVGMSYDSNEGAINAMTKGIASSCSVMMPCPWVAGFTKFLQEHPAVDAGLHLTLTSEWKNYRWGPLSGKQIVPGLVDVQGAMWPSVPEVVQHATPEEVEKEIHAQLERAINMGFTPTHLDSHMGTLFASPAFLSKYIQLGIDHHIPVMLPGGHATLINEQMKFGDAGIAQMRSIGEKLWLAGLPVLDDLHNMSYEWKLTAAEKSNDKKLREYKTKEYIKALRSLHPGITMVIMHCTATTEVFKHISDSGDTRRGDMLAMMDPALRDFIQKEGIIITTWRELKERRDKAGK
ncbi:MAG TPA: polysaccharide deacetylase family protein [Flavitalea sp.]|nr:polysaccharide deacetylase family protein [Flavitalea sp.]